MKRCWRSRVEVCTLVDVTLPSLGESVTEGIITQWFKRVGDVVARDEALLEVSTDKVDSELPSPAAGVLVEIVAQEGDTVQTGARVAVIDERSVTGSPPNVATSNAISVERVAPETTTNSVSSAEPRGDLDATTLVAPGVVSSPVVRRILADAGVDAATVRGTGPGGVVTRRDAEAAVSNGPTDERVVPLSNGQRRMGQHMTLSTQSTPHGFVAIEVDGAIFSRLDQGGRVTRDGVTITDEMVVALAAVRALGEFEFLNATFAGDEVVVHRTVNLGFLRAVVNDGMLVPVVHAAAGLTLRALARRVSELGERVLSRQLTTDDLMGGTFTLLGAPSEHALWSQPIIIHSQVALMSVGAVRWVPVVSLEDGAPQLVVGRRLILGLSFDHRVCEPVAAASYLERVGELLAGLDLESER